MYFLVDFDVRRKTVPGVTSENPEALQAALSTAETTRRISSFAEPTTRKTSPVLRHRRQALARGAISRFGAELGIGLTGIAGPGGGTEEKPVGTVCFCVAERDDGAMTRQVMLPGNRQDIRDRSTTVAMHMLRRVLLGERDDG